MLIFTFRKMLCRIAIFPGRHEASLDASSTVLEARGGKMLPSTFDHQREVAVCKSVLRHEDPPLVVGAVDTLIPRRVHVAEPLHLVVPVVGAVDIPVHHALPVVEAILGPHHAVALAGQDSLRAQRGADVQHGHYHAVGVGGIGWD